MSEQAYKPEITVVRKNLHFDHHWREDDGNRPENERAYLVRGLPMPGERVAVAPGFPAASMNPHTVTGIKALVLLGPAGEWVAQNLTPYDPEAEKVERVAKALHIQARHGDEWDVTSETMKRIYRDSARTAIAAMEDE